MEARLYVVAASHPCHAVMRALELKGIPYRRVEWLPTMHVPMQRLRFGRGTVPGIKLDGEKVIGSREIMRRLDELRPQPPLYPAEPELRARVGEADEWGEQVLQALARRITWWTLRHRPSAMADYAEDSRFPFPGFVVAASARLITPIEWRINDVSEERTQRDLAELPAHLERIDAWIAEGVLGGEQPNAADLQIGASLALLGTKEDLRPLLEAHRAQELARRNFPGFPGRVPAGTLPAEWLPAAA